MHKKRPDKKFCQVFFVPQHEVGFFERIGTLSNLLAPESLFASRVLLFQRKVAGFTASPSVGFGLVKH